MDPENTVQTDLKLGINGLGRIGKLTLWHHVGRRYFSEIVVNIGRKVGTGFDDILHYIARDSTYGHLRAFLYGLNATEVITDVNYEQAAATVNGVRVRFLQRARNPRDIDWGAQNTRLVVDTTGQFLDPSLAAEEPGGTLRGHLEAGAEKVILSAPFKIKDKGRRMPDDAVTTVMGVNDNTYDPRRHRLISNASCTTTCLAHMMKPLIDHFGPRKILSASMATVHAATSSQSVLDRLPGGGTTDLRKNRSILNNIILTTTGAAKALQLVIPEMEQIGFIAESVRIPTSTGSLIILVLSIQEDIPDGIIRRELINNLYRQAAADAARGYLIYTDQQNVSGDIVGWPRAGAVIEGHETHTRTAEVRIDLEKLPGLEQNIIRTLKSTIVSVPVTQAVIYGWYDNELGGYVNMLGDRTVTVAENL